MNNCCSSKWLSVFKAVSDKHRQRILFLIKKHKSLNASQIIKNVKLSQPTISHHLKILSNAGLVEPQKKGKEVIYSIKKKTITSCCLGLVDKLT